MRRLAFCVISFGLAVAAASADPGQVDPPLPDGTRDAQAKISTFRLPQPLQVELFAAEPQLASPVAICLDERGRVYVAEEYRFNRGTEENRTRPFLLDDDLQLQTVDDRLAMFRKHADKFDGGMEWFSRFTDQVRRLEDRDGDGRADASTVFAAGFNHPLDGLASGLIARDGNLYLTCIPNLWRLRDNDSDGIADQRDALLHGFGVNASFLGHDLHGLCWGPDGKLYFSVGDRGFHVRTKEGTVVAEPRRGAVFRCNQDGTELEVVHRGLRNPQELAFDDFGNLFAADNNCDKGDHSRLVYVVEGADSGWSMTYQTMPAPYETGPWHAEKIWHLDGDAEAEAIRPAWVLPPVGKLGAGPSGFAYCGAAGWSEHFRGRFFHCNFTGNGGIETFRVRSKGASFEVVGYEDFLKPISATDAEFGYDGKLYVSDFVGLDWSGKSRGGRIYTVFDKAAVESAETRQVRDLFAAGFKKRDAAELIALLNHQDQRVRQRAQFELADRVDASIPALTKTATSAGPLLSRLHAIWALGMIGKRTQPALEPIVRLMKDPEPEIRTQAARTLGDVKYASAGESLVNLLDDDNPRVQLHAAIALGRIKYSPALDPLLKLVRRNQSEDKYLRHACVFALSELTDRAALTSLSTDTDPAVRLTILLVLRRWQSPEINRFLQDSDWNIITEAARAVNDLPIDTATPQLAALAEGLLQSSGEVPEALARRVIHANYRLGELHHADSVARMAACETFSIPVRREAIAALVDWSHPPQRDRVNGNWRPLKNRDPTIVQQAVQPHLASLLSGNQAELQVLVTDAISRLGLRTDDDTFIAWAQETAGDGSRRVAALQLLASRKHLATKQLLVAALSDDRDPVRVAALKITAGAFPNDALPILKDVLDDDDRSLACRQQAIASLAELKSAAAGIVLDGWADKLVDAAVPASLQLDVVEALDRHGSAELKQKLARFEEQSNTADPLGKHRLAEEGGSAERGEKIFLGHRQAQCSRCHKVNDQGGEAGPNLSRVASRVDRKHLLASLVLPNLQIAPGYGSSTLLLADGTSVVGTVKSEAEGIVELALIDGTVRRLRASEIEERSQPISPMPAMDKVLTLRELRDVVEFLATQK